MKHTTPYCSIGAAKQMMSYRCVLVAVRLLGAESFSLGSVRAATFNVRDSW